MNLSNSVLLMYGYSVFLLAIQYDMIGGQGFHYEVTQPGYRVQLQLGNENYSVLQLLS